MSVTGADLALGTVQFGVAYGVAGRGEAVPEDEVRSLLEHAARAGVRVLDTAPAYGDIESRLGALIDDLEFEVISKVGALPDGVDARGAARFVEDSVARSVRRLGPRLTTLLFHRADNLLGPLGDTVWGAAEAASAGRLRLGASCYDPAELAELRRRYPIAVAQLPGNALDQRLAGDGVGTAVRGVEIHLRSVFLQGLLLMAVDAAARRVPAAAPALARWAEWCAGRGLPPLTAALGIARALPSVRYCVVGVDRLAQLEQILDAWEMAECRTAPSLACESLDIIDPRRWSAA